MGNQIIRMKKTVFSHCDVGPNPFGNPLTTNEQAFMKLTFDNFLKTTDITYNAYD